MLALCWAHPPLGVGTSMLITRELPILPLVQQRRDPRGVLESTFCKSLEMPAVISSVTAYRKLSTIRIASHNKALAY